MCRLMEGKVKCIKFFIIECRRSKVVGVCIREWLLAYVNVIFIVYVRIVYGYIIGYSRRLNGVCCVLK